MKKALLVKYEYTKRVVIDDCDLIDGIYKLMENNQDIEDKILLTKNDIEKLTCSPDTYLVDITEDMENPIGSCIEDYKCGDNVLVVSSLLSEPAHGTVEEILDTVARINVYDKNGLVGCLFCKPNEIKLIDNIKEDNNEL